MNGFLCCYDSSQMTTSMSRLQFIFYRAGKWKMCSACGLGILVVTSLHSYFVWLAIDMHWVCEPKVWQIFVIANTKIHTVYSVQTGEIKVFHGRVQGRGPRSHSIHRWHHYGMFGKPLVCVGVHTTEVTMEQQLLLLWRISNDKKYVHITIPFLLCI